MGKGSSETVKSNSSIDPQMMKYRNEVFDRARQIGDQRYQRNQLGIAGMDPNSRAAAEAYRQATGGLGIGMDAMKQGLGMSWNADTAGQYMNPYQSQVMDQWNKQFGDMRQNTLNDVNQQAMQSGAFGGSRHGVAEGQALADLGKAQAMQQAGLLQSGYDTAYGQFANDRNTQLAAGQNMANLGFGGAQGLMGYGQAAQQTAQNANLAKWQEEMRRQGWSQDQLGAMIAAMQGAPYSQKASQTTKSPGNLFGDIAGVGLGALSFL